MKQDNPAVERCILPIQYTVINIRAKWFHILIKYENNIINAFHKATGKCTLLTCDVMLYLDLHL